MSAWKRHIRFGCGGLIAGLGLLGCAAPGGVNSTQKPNQPISSVQENPAQPTVDQPEPEVLPQTHMAAGQLHESQNNLARAVEQYRLAIAAQPNYVDAYNRLGIVMDRLVRFKEADDAFARAIELAPNQPHLHNNLGFSYTMQSRWADAESELKKALELNPDFARARVNLAMVLAQQDRFEEAKQQFIRGLAKADAYYNMGLMYQSKHMEHEAAQAYKTALEFKPEMTAARGRLAMLPEDVVSSVQGGEVQQASPAQPSAARTQKPLKVDQSARPHHEAAKPAPAVAPTASPEPQSAHAPAAAEEQTPAPKPEETEATANETEPAAESNDEAAADAAPGESEAEMADAEKSDDTDAEPAETDLLDNEPSAVADSTETGNDSEEDQPVVPSPVANDSAEKQVVAQNDEPAEPIDQSLFAPKATSLPNPDELVTLADATPRQPVEAREVSASPQSAAPSTQPAAEGPSRATLELMAQRPSMSKYELCWELFDTDRLPEKYVRARQPRLQEGQPDIRNTWAAPDRVRNLMSGLEMPLSHTFGPPVPNAVSEEKLNSPDAPLVRPPARSSLPKSPMQSPEP